MSCPGIAFHAHAPLAAEAQPETTARRTGIAWMSGWVVSLIGHAGVAAIVLLTPPAEHPDEPTGSILVELVGPDAAGPVNPDRAIAAASPEPTHTPPLEHIEATKASESKAIPTEHTLSVEVPAPVEASPVFPIPPSKPVPPQAIVVPVDTPVQSAQNTTSMPPANAEAKINEHAGTMAGPAETSMRPSGAASSLAKTIGENRKPVYPAYARRRGIEGRVILGVTVSADGKVANVGVVQSSRYDVLDEAAVEAVRKWRFHPARENGKAVASNLNVPITFRLNDER